MENDNDKPQNLDANDVEQMYGLGAVRRSLEMAEHPWPAGQEPPPYEEEIDGELPQADKIDFPRFTWRPTEEIPPRKWLYGTHLVRQFVSVDVAAGGVGKSSLKVVEALAMASGMELLNKALPEGPLRVCLYNLEDPAEEIERRIHAAAKYYNLVPEDFIDRLHVVSGRDQPLVVAEETPSGARIIRPVTERIIELNKKYSLDVLVIDPFISSHHINENDNMAVDMVAKEWSRIADESNCAINLVHHVRKANGTEVTAESSRGAVALLGAARSVVVYNRMSEDEADEAGVMRNQRGFYFRTQNDKANLAPFEAAEWHRMNNVDLPNGDSVGVAAPWQWPDPFEGVSAGHLMKVQRECWQNEWMRMDPRSPDWIGNKIAEILGWDAGADRAKIEKVVDKWVQNGALKVVSETCPKRKKVLKFARSGDPIQV